LGKICSKSEIISDISSWGIKLNPCSESYNCDNRWF
jgi:hypothetical protein